MDEPKPIPLAESTPKGTAPEQTVQPSVAKDSDFARGSAHVIHIPPAERTEHSVMEGLPAAKAERVAAMRRELAELQRQLIDAQQRIASELQGRAEDAERFEAVEARLQAQEVEVQKVAMRGAELETEIAGLRAQLASATTTAQELRRDISERDGQVEEARRQHRDATEQLEAQRTSLQEATTLLETRNAELEDQRKQQREVSDRLELEASTVRDAKALVGTRDTELAAMTAERDTIKGELEQAQRELDAARTKTRDIGNQLVKLGQTLVDDVGIVPTTSDSKPRIVIPPPIPERPQPPPLPALRVGADAKSQEIETIIEVVESKPAVSRVRSGLLLVGGVLVGCAVTIAIMKQSTSSSTAAGYGADLGTSPSAAVAAPLATEPALQTGPSPVRGETITEPSTVSAQPTPAADNAVNAGATTESAPLPSTTDGAIVLPAEAEGHRVFIDGRLVAVKDLRAVVPCGARELRIGSRGTPRMVDVACSGDTEVGSDPQDR